MSEPSNSDIGLNTYASPAYDVVRQARHGAVRLGKNESARIILKRAEVLVLVHGLLERQGLNREGPYLTEADWSAAGEVSAIRELLSSLTVNQQAALKNCLGQDAELSLLDLDSNRRGEIALCLDRAEQCLTVPLDHADKQRRRTKIRSWIRVGTVAAVALFCLEFFGPKLSRLSRAQNIALHRPTEVSSMSGEGTHGAELVDGITDNLGFHTNSEPNPYVVIDLGASRRFDKIVVFNRADCCQERAIPLSVDVSDDGTTFRNIANRYAIFEEWTVKGLHEKGRYVRFQLKATQYFHLAEVEIY